MALSMDEQRMLEEIERRLAAEDPGLAARMSAFKRPGPATMFRSARARLVGSLLTVVVVAMVSLVVYAMIPFRSNATRNLDPGGHPGGSRGQPVMTVASAGAGGARAAKGTKASTAATPAGRANSSAPAQTSGSGTSKKDSSRTKSTTSGATGSPSAAANAKPATPALHGP